MKRDTKSDCRNANSYLMLVTLLLCISGLPVQHAAAQERSSRGGNNPNPLQVALLKWSPNLTTSFTVGGGPVGFAFDGANIWLANSFTVTKLRASDGALQTFSVAGCCPAGLAFDG